MIFLATNADGKVIGDVLALEDAALMRKLRPYVFHIIKAAAVTGKPFAAGKCTNLIISQSNNLVKNLFPRGSSSKVVPKLVD